MLKITITNTKTYLSGDILDDWGGKAKDFKAELRKVLSYQVPGADFSPQYKEGHWDGLISLWSWSDQSFPTGCLSFVLPFLKREEIKYKIYDARIKPEPNTKITTTFAEHGRKLYFYQDAAVENAYKAGRGVLSMATGSGKTMVACELLSKIRTVPFLFYVPSISLLRQTHREFTKYLKQNGKPIHVGFIGASVCDINLKGINVITYQTALSAFNEIYHAPTNTIKTNDLAGEIVKKTFAQIQQEYNLANEKYKADLKVAQKKHRALKQDNIIKFNKSVDKDTALTRKALNKATSNLEIRQKSLKNKKLVRQLIRSAKGFVVDEAHVAAVIVEALGNHAEEAYWRVGCTGTAFREDNQEIRIQGTMGKKLIEISASDLIDLGFLVPPKIYMLKLDHFEKIRDYRECYNIHIVNSWERNYRIKQCAEALKEQGRPVLILVEQIEHGLILEQMITDSVFVAGSSKGEDDPGSAERDYRRRMLNKTEANEIILIATQWAYVGIDAPAISALVLAGSCASTVAVYQMIGRVLRKHDESGKSEAVIIDFIDRPEKLHQHSLTRRRIYNSERSWHLKIIKGSEIAKEL